MKDPWPTGQVRARVALDRAAVVLSSLLAIVLLSALALEPVAAQSPPATGRLVGRVLTSTSDPLPGVEVGVAALELRAVTDADGSFALDLPSGEHRVTIALAGYATEFKSTTVTAGADATLEVRLLPATVQTLVKIGKLAADSERGGIVQRARAATTKDIIGRQEMAAQNVSNAAAGAAKTPGVSVVDGKFVVVRGLGGRYSLTLVDNRQVPSPEPERRVVPLDLFPANLIERLEITKGYSPDLPGEFAGGCVQVNTTGVPAVGFFKISFSTDYQDGTTFRGFRTYDGGSTDDWSFDDGTRELPGLVPSSKVGVGQMGLTADTIRSIGLDFDNIWESERVTARPDHKLSISYGDRFGAGDLGTLGVVSAVNWSNKFQRVDDEEVLRVINSGMSTQNAFNLDTSTFQAELSGLLNLTLELNPAQSIGIRNFYSRSSSDRVRQQTGFDTGLNTDVRVEQFQYVERSILTSQLFGEHLLIGDLFLRWHAAYALTERDVPDRRQIQYTEELNGDFTFRDVFESGSRDFLYQEETVTDLALDLSIPFNPLGIDDPDQDPDELNPSQRIQLGISLVDRDREFEARRFRFVPSNTPTDVNGDPIDLTLPPEQLFAPDNINPDGFELTEFTRPQDAYEGTQELNSIYGLVSFRVHPRVRLHGGVRAEDSDQKVSTVDPFSNTATAAEARIDEVDLMPVINVAFEVYEQMQVRVGASRTVSRPEFRELSPFQFRDQAGGFAARGNPDLDRALITSYDLRWEWFPVAGDLYSVSAFYKEFKEPIEKVIIPTASDAITTWDNAEEAEVLGFEFELRKGLGFISPKYLANFALKTNYALIDSEVTVSDNPLFVQTNDKRPLEGQPEYTWNAGLFYESDALGLSWAVLLSTFGPSVSGVGSQGVDDEIEQPRYSLDFTLSQNVGNGSIGLTVENILDDDFRFEQNGYNTRKYRKGISVGLSYSISF
ncbi:MAG: TonB-dependent receptor [Planctomycetota bacterium]